MKQYTAIAIKNALSKLTDEDGKPYVLRAIHDGSHAVDAGKGGETICIIRADGWLEFHDAIAVDPRLAAALAGVQI